MQGNFQERILEWLAISYSRGSFWHRDWSQASRTACRFFTVWATLSNKWINEWMDYFDCHLEPTRTGSLEFAVRHFCLLFCVLRKFSFLFFWPENTLVIANTFFQQPKKWLYTWTSPDGQYQNWIDYVFCILRWRSSIQSAHIRPGPDCGSHHELFIAKFRLKLKKVGKTTRSFRYDLHQYLMSIQWRWWIDSRD